MGATKQIQLEQMERPTEPCPFCGTPACCEDGEHEPNVKISSHKNIDLDVGVCADVFYAYCIMCGAQGPASKSEVEAISEWNRRP